MKTNLLLSTIAIPLIAATGIQAQDINVNFYASNGSVGLTPQTGLLGAAGGPDETWNQLIGNGSNLLNTTGAATTVGLTGIPGSGWGATSGSDPELTLFIASRAQFSKGADTNFTITGLTPGTTYDVYLYAYNQNTSANERPLGTWSTTNTTTSPSSQLIDARTGYVGTTSGDSFTAGFNYVRFENVAASGAGQIAFSGDAADVDDFDALAYRLHLNGIQIRATNPVVAGPVDAGASTVASAAGTVNADGTSTTTVTVTLRDAGGLAIAGEEVTLSNPDGSAVIGEPATVVTDASGQATFTVSSSTAGIVEFVATVITADNLVITQTATVEFVAPATSDIFSVNLFAYGRQVAGDVWTQESARQTVRLAPTDSAGAAGFTTTGWQNVQASIGTTAITSTQGSTATFKLLDQRNAGPYYWTTTRNSSTFGIPNASLLDGHSNGTFDPGDATLHSILEVSNIPFAAYDVAIYLGVNQAQREQGKGAIRINGGAAQPFTMLSTEPNGTLVEITDEFTVGNFLVFRGFSEPTFRAEILGDGFTHLGPAGIQISKADRAREPLEITDYIYDSASGQATLTWTSFPGDQYGVYWSEDMKEFAPIIHPAVPAHETDVVTTFGPFLTPVPDAPRGFFRIGPPDLFPPVLDRVWGNNHTISLTFSEPIASAVGTNPANFAVVKNGGGTWAVESATFHPARETIVLTTSAPLDLDATYTVTLSNLTDLAGRPLDGQNTAEFRTWDDNPAGVKVFILVGQSNMVGRGSLETGNGGVAGAIGSLRYQAVNDTANYGHLLVDPSQPATSAWINRSDVKVWWNRADIGGASSITKGNLGPATLPTFGPEYGFGWAVGELYDEPVLLIKSCWGGKSLFVDFRPPSAAAARGGEVGRYYLEVFKHVRQVLDGLGTQFPEWNGLGYQIAGFGWHQGWNDAMNPFPAAEYEANLANLIDDLRAEFGKPALPVSIGATGHGGFGQGATFATVVAAQLAVADPGLYPEFAGTVFTSDTRPFWRAASVSPANDTSHWNNNGESFFLMGKGMGDGTVNLLGP